ncbi:DUF4395 domain-containing protein [Ornithinibacter aureus]|uniref:DUF4395 domain-containing protein n=1 Tax=Ornithinibacter aureus TaxID=622664 RepID=A0ABP8K6J5_9MICO|nr:DUF4395 domain-containing protein [Ornithinibacter aureus]KAF0834921.1 uncharacterized protein DUF4395 [Ornithinibacter aureus]
MVEVRTPFEFPAIVNEKAARVVAGLVVLVAALALLTGWLWLSAVLAVGFALRVASGPRFDPFGLLATTVIAPRLGEPVMVPGPPKRFAQAIGLVLTLVATGFLVAGLPAVTTALLAILLVFATLESALGFCAGCYAFGLLMRAGLVPEETCAACNDISLRQRQPAGV